jgi:hypothetical protein
LRLVEHDEHADALVIREAVLRAGFHVRGSAFHERDLLALDDQRRTALENEIDLVPLVRLLGVGFGSDET